MMRAAHKPAYYFIQYYKWRGSAGSAESPANISPTAKNSYPKFRNLKTTFEIFQKSFKKIKKTGSWVIEKIEFLIDTFFLGHPLYCISFHLFCTNWISACLFILKYKKWFLSSNFFLLGCIPKIRLICYLCTTFVIVQ